MSVARSRRAEGLGLGFGLGFGLGLGLGFVFGLGGIEQGSQDVLPLFGGCFPVSS